MFPSLVTRGRLVHPTRQTGCAQRSGGGEKPPFLPSKQLAGEPARFAEVTAPFGPLLPLLLELEDPRFLFPAAPPPPRPVIDDDDEPWREARAPWDRPGAKGSDSGGGGGRKALATFNT